MTLTKLCLVALVSAFCILIVKEWKSDFASLLRIYFLLAVGAVTVGALEPLLNWVRELTGSEAFATYVSILIKALGVAFLTEYAANLCRSCGEAEIANGVELAGKAELLLLSIPLINDLLSLAGTLFSLGGGTN